MLWAMWFPVRFRLRGHLRNLRLIAVQFVNVGFPTGPCVAIVRCRGVQTKTKDGLGLYQSRGLVFEPACPPQRANGEHFSARGNMREFKAFSGTR